MSDEKKRYTMIEECYVDVVRYLSAFDLSEADLEDAIQDTFVEAFSKAGQLRDEEKVKHWIIKIARSKGRKYKIKSSILVTIECAFREDVVQLSCQETYEDDVLTELILNSEMKALIDSIKNLNEKEQKALILQYVYGEKLKDIAIILGENLNNTKSISRRAKEKARKFLLDGGYEYGR